MGNLEQFCQDNDIKLVVLHHKNSKIKDNV